MAAVTEQYLAAIESLQSLNAITVVNPKAVEEAAKLDVSLTYCSRPCSIGGVRTTINNNFVDTYRDIESLSF